MTELDRATPIELPVWQAPNDNVLLKQYDDSLDVFFKIWIEAGRYSKYTGVLSFENVWAMRFERHKKLHYYPNSEDDDFNSCYWIIHSSSWLKKLQDEREGYFPDWFIYDKKKYKHYIVQSNQYYIEIVASEILYARKRKNIWP